jgi:hypothetical protein
MGTTLHRTHARTHTNIFVEPYIIIHLIYRKYIFILYTGSNAAGEARAPR